LKRENATPNLGFASRPFVLCGLPIKRPAKGVLLHERRNGQFLLQVTGHPTYGVPWGQDRLVPIFLATLAIRQQKPTIRFRSARRNAGPLWSPAGWHSISAFDRFFPADLWSHHLLWDGHATRKSDCHASIALQLYAGGSDLVFTRRRQDTLPAFENEIVLSEKFFREVTKHSIPTDLEAAKALSSAPAALDLFMWLSYRCFTAKGLERIPIFGDFGLATQLGNADYARPRKFRERLDRWLKLVRALWAECPA
jgi:hypothetical protein